MIAAELKPKICQFSEIIERQVTVHNEQVRFYRPIPNIPVLALDKATTTREDAD